MLPIVQRVIDFCWACFKWGLLLVVVGIAAGAVYLRYQMGEEIRSRVLARVAKLYGHLQVAIRSAALVDEGIEIRGLSLSEPGVEGPRAELLFLDEVCLECSTDLRDLVCSELDVKRVTLRRPVLRATLRPNGTWSTAKLLPLPKVGEHPPQVTVEGGTIEIVDPQRDPSSTLSLKDVNLTLTPQAIPDQPGKIDPMRQLKGTFSADHLWRVSVEGQIDPERQLWSLAGSIEGLDVSPELRNVLPAPLAAKLAVLGELRGQGTFSFRVDRDPARPSPYSFEVAGRLEHGRIDDPRLPHPLSDLRARFSVNNEGLMLDELTARSGQATLRLSARQQGLDLKGPLTLEAEIRQLELDQQLYDVLPAPLQTEWLKYRPAGRIDANAKLTYDGQTWRPDLTIQCVDVSFTHHKFPYRLEHATGPLIWQGDLLTANLTAHSGDQPVRIDAEVQHPLAGPSGQVVAKGENLVLDEKLLMALSEQSRAVVRALDPRGTFDFYLRFARDGPDRPLRKEILVGLNQCSIRYERFPYPIENIRGTLRMVDDQWTFDGLEGNNDSGRITVAEGRLSSVAPGQQQGRELMLRLRCSDVALDDELRGALRPNVQRVWDSLRPRGTVDLETVVKFAPAAEKLQIWLRALPHPETTSIEPVYFPYRLEKLQGLLEYRDGYVTLQDFKAEHGAVRMAARVGDCRLFPDGGWDFRLRRVSVDRLRLDRELVPALPGKLRKAVLELNPSGPLNLQGEFTLQGGAQAGDPLRSSWDLAIDFRQASIDCGIKLENMFGGMTLVGGFDGQRFHSVGELVLDSLTYRDFQVTQVKGPLWVDDEQVLLGSWVARRRGGSLADGAATTPRAITGKLFGGTVYGDAWVALGPIPRYGLHAVLSQGDLGHCAQEMVAGRQHLQGKILATVDLGGTGRSLNALSGQGNIQLRDADIYELPLMIALLKILSVREPDSSAFSKADINFIIRGCHIYFKQINFNGDAISLLGQGEMDLQTHIALNFYAIVGRGEIDVPIIKELLAGASQQIMQIRVGGTLRNPETHKDAFPVVNQALQQLQNDLQGGTASQGAVPAVR